MCDKVERLTDFVSNISDLRNILARNIVEQPGPHTITLPDGTTHTGPVVDFLHDLIRVQIRALDAALGRVGSVTPPNNAKTES